ncbi:hypothetical protein WKH92_20095, partial [Xanthomonas oryzae pv. oryzae]
KRSTRMPGNPLEIQESHMKAVASVVRDDTGKGRLAMRGRSETLTVSQPFMSLFRGMQVR